MSVASAYELLNRLDQLGVKLYLDGENLRFNAPKGVLEGELLLQVKEAKPFLIAILSVEDIARMQLEQPLKASREDSENGYPLTFAQRRFWFLDRLAGGNSPIYNMLPIAFQLEGELNIDAVRQSIRLIVERHPFLAVRFDIHNGEPRQWPLSGQDPEVLRMDLSTDKDPLSRVEEEILKQGERPFDLQKGGALLRIALLKISESTHVFILTVHHIVADGWSLGILVEEFTKAYQAYSNGAIPSLPEIPAHYGDFAHWEKTRLSHNLIDHYLHFWKQELKDVPTFLELPTDFSRPSRQTYHGQTHTFVLPQVLYQQLKTASLRAGVTPFMFLMSVFSLLLHRYTGSDDFVIGTPRSVRKHTETESLIGLFLNTLPIRINTDPNDAFMDLLHRVKSRSLRAFEHDEVPFDELLQALDIKRELDRTPLFQVLFALQNTPVDEIRLDHLTITPVETQNSKAPFDLVLSMEEIADGLEGRFRYNTDLFKADTIERLSEHFLTLIAQVLEDTDSPLSRYSLLTGPEADFLTAKSRSVQDIPVTEMLHQRVERMAKSNLNAVAVVDDQSTLTYAELLAKADRIALQLIRSGVQPNDRVGLCMSRSTLLIAAIQGIHKAGAAYVPLDPSYPAERLEYMSLDSGLKIIITDTGSQEFAPSGPFELLNVDPIDFAESEAFVGSEGSEAFAESEGSKGSESKESSEASLTSNSAASLSTLTHDPDPASELDLSRVAYVIYTSGSTGRPKGVEVTHENVMRLFLSCEELYDFSNQDYWTLFHSYSFDFSVWEIWGALLYGGRLRVISYETSRNPEVFYRLCRDEKITVLNQTPSAFRQFMEADRKISIQSDQKAASGTALSLRWVIFGGEALDMASLKNWSERHGLQQPVLVNMYGITETTVHVTYQRITEKEIEEGGSTIGIPIPDLIVELLDEQGSPVPVGVPGELWVGGKGVAKGYLNRPELTGQRFVTRADLAGDERVFYRSGDLAKWRSDGSLEYMGRIDQQVKIRGFRIELGEIETRIQQMDFISTAVVTVFESSSGPELIAYVVPRDAGTNPDPSIIRKHLTGVLPDYMIPGAFIPLDEIPLTQNGKVNKRALPQPDRSHRITARAYKEPSTPLERLIADLWKEVLGIDLVGCTDNFFELGGDSIKGAIFSNRMQEAIGEIFFVVALFEAPTIDELTAYMDIHYPDAVRRIMGLEEQKDEIIPVTRQDWEAFRSEITPLTPYPAVHQTPRNPRAIFVLAPPRSGTTLLRVLLGGHSALFSPPELELMPFNTLSERKQICSGRDAFWLEGTLRALMEIHHYTPDEAKAAMDEYELSGMSIKAFYGVLQGWLDDRILVDKSPSYVLHSSILERIEETFEDAFYIHLHRHPLGMIHSFEEAKLHQIFFRYPYSVTHRQLAELIWTESHMNIRKFLSGIPQDRQVQIGFEELTSSPEHHVRRMVTAIGLEFEEGMLAVYDEQEKKKRMTDGLYKESTMLGDVKFHTHKGISSRVAERWKSSYSENFLGQMTLETAEHLGYSVQEIEQTLSNQKRLLSNSSSPKTSPNLTQASADSAQVQAKGTSIHPRKTPSKNISRSGVTGSKTPVSVSVDELTVYPLSQAQQRLWILDQIEGQSAVYNMPVALWLNGDLSVKALQEAVHRLTIRHEVLRSRFITRNGVPKSVIYPAQNVFTEIDLRHIGGSEREKTALEIAEKESMRPFRLSEESLFRAIWINLSEDRSLLVLNMHHIVSDGWSMGVIARDLEGLYKQAIHESVSTGSDKLNATDLPLLPDLPIQYGDFAEWESSWMNSPSYEKQLDYWKTTLSGIPSQLELPSDRPRPAVLSYRGQTIRSSISVDRSQLLRAFAEKENSSLYMLFLTGFSCLLHRYTGQETIVVGSPSANRSRKEIENLVGFFVNTLVMRVDIDPEISFSELLKQTRKTALNAYQHQDISFEKLVDEVQPQRHLGFTPLFQVMLAMQNTPLELPRFANVIAEPVNHSSPISKYDLTLTVSDQEDEITIQAEYSTDLFDSWRIEQLLSTLETLLIHAVQQPDTPVLSLPVLPKNDISYKLSGPEASWDSLPSSHPQLLQQIAKVAQRNGQKTALQASDKTLSYQELEQASNQLAHRLIRQGVSPGDRVAVMLPRTSDLVVTLLAVIKTGACYIPIDPEFPEERISIIIEDSHSTLLLTYQPLVESVQVTGSILYIDQDRDSIAQESEVLPSVDITSSDLMYIIFTSGSTGRPKGVMLSHGAVSNFIQSMIELLGLSSEDRFLATTTISFDIAVLEIWGTLFSGGECILANEAEAKDGEKLHEYMSEQQITFMQATPVTWKMLLTSGWEGSEDLTVLCGGEALHVSTARELFSRAKRVWNLYGPTETTVWSSALLISEDRVKQWATADQGYAGLGKPIHNTSFYLLDHHLQPVPTGVPGELYIGGSGVANGYIHREDQTSQRFIQNPFNVESQGSEQLRSSFSDSVLYKTGDLVRRSPDGEIEFIGRSDHQIKLRGYRIELEEIETQLKRIHQVRDAVVEVIGEDDHKKLAAFIRWASDLKTIQEKADSTSVPQNHSGIPNSFVIYPLESSVRAEVKSSLSSVLPEYMIPTTYFTISELPLTPNGKLDRNVLKQVREDGVQSVESALPRDPVELALINVWKDLLQRKAIGIHENFFELGGHSLIAVRLMASLNEIFGVKLPISVLFKGPTVSELAAFIRQSSPDDHTYDLLTLKEGSHPDKHLFLAAGAGGNVLYLHALASQIPDLFSVYGFQPSGLDGIQPPSRTVEEIAHDYMEQLTEILPSGNVTLMGHSFGGYVVFELAKLLIHAGREIDHVILLDTPSPNWYQPTGIDWSDAKWMSQITALAAHQYGIELTLSEKEYQSQSSMDEMVELLNEELIKNDIFPSSMSPQFLKGFLQVYKSNLMMDYAPEKVPLDLGIVLIRSADLQPESIADARANEFRSISDFGWSAWVNGSVNVIEVPGDHLTMLAEEHVSLWGPYLQKILHETSEIRLP